MFYFVVKFLDSQQYSYITNINDWAGVQWDMNGHMGTLGWETVKVIVSQSIVQTNNVG